MSANDAKKLADKLFPIIKDDDVAIIDIPPNNAAYTQKLMISQSRHL